MNRRGFVQIMIGGIVALLRGRESKAATVRPADQKYIHGDVVRVVGANGTSTWWADRHIGELRRIRGSYRDLYGDPVYRPPIGAPGNGPRAKAFCDAHRQQYEHSCRDYSCTNLDGTGASSWWNEECFEPVRLVWTDQ